MYSPQGPLPTAEPTVKMELEAEQTLADMATNTSSSHPPRETANGCDEHEHDGLVPYERERLQNIARNNAAFLKPNPKRVLALYLPRTP
eukprot:COSAG04_NODE_11133_length_728_cov_1.394277_2_plen_89_part_00